MVVHTFDLSSLEAEAGLVYMESSRPVRADSERLTQKRGEKKRKDRTKISSFNLTTSKGLP